MTVGELKELIEDLPEDMDVFMPLGEDALVTVCYSNSDIHSLDAPGEPQRDILLLLPCTCAHDDDLPIDLETHPN